MIAALRVVKGRKPHEVIVAVPAAPAHRIEDFRRCCDQVVCLSSPGTIWSIGAFYEELAPVQDDEVVSLLQVAATSERAAI